jgi:PAS domain S-box-containing protein
VGGAVLAIAIVDRHHESLLRLARERERLKAALAAAKAAVWELSPDGKLYWDENFYRLVGLTPEKTPPATSTFLEMIHPEDRPRMAEARRLMDERQEPSRVDEYRLTRPDGETVWLENHRTRVVDNGDYFIGITQDITRRKLAEERVQALLREAEHRAKNQFSIILSIARETRRTTGTLGEFEEAFGGRLKGLARSHELMVKGDWRGTTIRQLLLAHLEPFAAVARAAIDGPEIVLSPRGAQYLGMAFHELATNAAKYGALSVEKGRLEVTWRVTEVAGENAFSLTWSERGGPPPPALSSSGFGSLVLLRLVPAAFGGRSSREMAPTGLVWNVTAPLSGLAETEEDEKPRAAPAA